jgi:hypothetical protein
MENEGICVNQGLKFLEEHINNGILFSDHLFPNIIIFSALIKTKGRRANFLKSKLANQLLKQRDKNWTFNYWCKESQNYKTEPYPNDLDDTCCALAALYEYRPSLLDGLAWAKIINTIVSCEVKEGGPYRTWITSKYNKLWDNVDLAVNSNIAYLLKLLKVRLRNLDCYFDNKIASDDISSRFYKKEIIILYFLSRSYRGKYKKTLKEKIKKSFNSNLNSLEKALIISSLINLGEKQIKNEWINQIIDSQDSDGSFEAADFYFYDFKNGNQFIKDKNLTTALVIECLTKYKFLTLNHQKTNRRQKDYRKTVKAIVREELKTHNLDGIPVVKQIVNRVIKNENILDFPYAIYLLLRPNIKNKFNNGLLINIGVIQIVGWCAYTLYDDFIDKDGNDTYLTTAECLKQILQQKLIDLKIDSNFYVLCQNLLYKLEYSYWWELEYYSKGSKNFGKYLNNSEFTEYLSWRLGGNLLIIAVILSKTGYKSDSEAGKSFLDIFYRYFIAKQIIDDIEDWQNDLKKGRLSIANKQFFTANKPELDLKENFIKTVLPELQKQIIKMSSLAIKEIGDNPIVGKKFLAKTLIRSNIEVVNHTRNITKKAVEFIENYYK